jgi:WhiB family redox-sensing transcriptional regulator
LYSLRELLDVPAWYADAACKGMDPALFYPEGPNDTSLGHAIRVCRSCPVRRDCLEHAIATNEQRGVWGGVGMSAHGRRRQAFLVRALEREYASPPMSTFA